jgi:proteasome lid subunit RPN8/RPN11
MSRRARVQDQSALRIDSEVVRQIRQHARSENKTEVCGVLIGRETADGIDVSCCIAGVNAAQGGAHVTFTQDTWEHIYKIKDKDYPNERILGWYHSHPGFGVFLSEHDTFIHRNFFSSKRQVAWVYDPHSDEEGCFGWQEDRIVRLTQVDMVDRRGGESAETAAGPKPAVECAESDTAADAAARPMIKLKADPLDSSDHSLERMASAMITHLSVLLLGFALSYFFFPKIVMMAVPIDPQTGVPLGPVIEIPADKVRELMKHAVEADQPAKSPQPSTAPSADPGKGANVQH